MVSDQRAEGGSPVPRGLSGLVPSLFFFTHRCYEGTERRWHLPSETLLICSFCTLCLLIMSSLWSTIQDSPYLNSSKLPNKIIFKLSKALLITYAERRKFIGEKKCEDYVDFPSLLHGSIQTPHRCSILVDSAG